MARASLFRSVRRSLARVLAPEMVRGHDAAGWKRFPREARMGRTANETLAAAGPVRSKARYFTANDAHAAAGVNALVTYSWGAGAVPAHDDSDLVAEFLKWWDVCDADGRTDFGGLGALAIRAMIVDGDCLVIFRQRPEGLRLQLMPAEQLDESLTRELTGGGYIAAGVEFNAAGERVAYWIRPYIPTQQFETWASPVRVDAADVLHLFKPEGIGQVRGVSWLAPIMLKLADLGLLSDALLKGFQVAAMHAGFLEDQNGIGGVPFEGEKDGDALDVSLEPGVVRRLPAGYKITFNNPQAAQQSIEFLTAQIEEVAAGLGVPAFMVSGNVSRANYSSLRAALISFRANLEALQHNILVPQLLAPIWRRWLLTQQLRGERDADATAAEWRFPAMPEADPVKQVQAVKLMLDSKLMSRAEAIAARGESIDRVDADIAADPHAQKQTDESTDSEESEDSNAA
jgi:lambda family phage portal protein